MQVKAKHPGVLHSSVKVFSFSTIEMTAVGTLVRTAFQYSTEMCRLFKQQRRPHAYCSVLNLLLVTSEQKQAC